MNFDPTPKYYTYIWVRKDTDEIIYVGKGSGNRYKTKRRENPYFMRVVSKYECEPIIFFSGLTEKEAFDAEKMMISVCRKEGCPLTNILYGGEQPPSAKGMKRSASTKKRMSESLKRAFAEHPELAKQASDRLKEFLQTDKGKEFQRKSIESRSTDEFKKRYSEVCRKANNTKEYLERQSKIIKDVWLSDAYREAHSGANNCNAQRVVQLSMDGEKIREFETITQAANETGANVSKISAVCKGKRKSTAGYRWAFVADKKIVLKRENKYDPSKDKNAKAVMQYTKSGEFVAEYYSTSEAARRNPQTSRIGILKCLHGEIKTAYGYVWRYK